MALLNYSTSISVDKTIGEIQKCLAKHGATAILTEYGGMGRIEAISFTVDGQYGKLAFRLPVNPEAVQKVLIRQNVPRRYCDDSHVDKVSWRIVKDWIKAQMAILETEMVDMAEIFLPYMITATGKTLYSSMRDRAFLLTEGENGK